MGQVFSDRVDNFVEKGENAVYQYFLLFLQRFQKPSFLVVRSLDCLGKGQVCQENLWSNRLQTQNFPKQALVFMCLKYKSFENTVGKGEIARNEQFLLFPQCFYPLGNFPSFPSNLELSSANSFSLEGSKICLGKG